ncbi:MAG: lipopolysaccharide heptosyltransferase I [Proteobacteria bacterium]|nr:lipopolysaccharide heptosyltransferase I [Pseudomonadota bacterium]
MRVLFIKLTSMGDLIHALPALTDASRIIPGIKFDWVIDKNFSEVALWHPAVDKIITTRHRYWRKNLRESIQNGELSQFYHHLREKKYDLVIDGQTSMKSALVTLLSRGPAHGLDKRCASEWTAALAYRKSYFIPKDWHAIQRLRMLLANALNYTCPTSVPDYHIKDYPFSPLKFSLPKPYLLFVHNASWSSKMWPEDYWQQLIKLAQIEGYHVLLPWGNSEEKKRAERICSGQINAQVLPFCSLSEMACILRGAAGAICSDTGLCHLAAALDVPSITLYGSTDPELIGSVGYNQQHLTSSFECFKCYRYECDYGNQKHKEPVCLLHTKPETVWKTFCSNLSQTILKNNYYDFVKS